MADTSAYVRYSPSVEKAPPNETEDIQAVADMINAMQKAQYNNHRHAFGGTHARTQGIAKGELTVPDDLPTHLKQSMFAQGGKYPIVIRFSSEPGDPGLDDRIAQPRGCAFKVFNINGDFLPEGQGIPTQDFEFNSTPALDLADAKTTREIIDLRIKYGSNQPELYKHLEARKDTELQKARDSVHNTHMESIRYYSQTAYRFGDYIAKFALVPAGETQKRLYDEVVSKSDPSDILSEWMKSFCGSNDGEFLFQFQLCENLDDQPVEYAGKVWDAEKYPWQTVGKVVIPKQDSFNYERKTFWEDQMTVNPWHGLKTLQPLGSPNRLRKIVYPASRSLRRKMNGRKEIHVKDINEVP
ncbi:MAG: cell division control protein [Chaenotheca gracillima]|nr:MAG: cell division control protein [Chaenotheca gracillima]